jgi:hypothetical protein
VGSREITTGYQAADAGHNTVERVYAVKWTQCWQASTDNAKACLDHRPVNGRSKNIFAF